MFTLRVLGHAQPAGSKRGFVRGKNVVVVDANKKAAGWKQLVALAAQREFGDREPYNQPLSVVMSFTMLRPKSHFTKYGTLSGRAPASPTTRPDVLKLARAVEDALTGIVWRDDALIVREVLEKKYGHQASLDLVLEPMRPFLI